MANKGRNLMVRMVAFNDDRSHLPIRSVIYCDPYGLWRNWFVLRDGNEAEPIERSFTNIRFMWNNLWDSGAITSSTEQVEFEDDKTQQRWLEWPWRSTAGNEQWLKRDLGSPQNIKAFILNNHWFLPSMGAVKVQAHADDTHWANPDLNVDLEVTYPEFPLVKFWDSNQGYRWWRFYMKGDMDNIVNLGDNEDCPYCTTRFKAGRIFLGSYFSPSVNFKARRPLKMVERISKIVSDDGQIQTKKWMQYKVIEYDFDFLTQSDIDSFEDIFDSKGKATRFWICDNEQYWWKETRYACILENLDIQKPEHTDNATYSLKIVVETVE